MLFAVVTGITNSTNSKTIVSKFLMSFLPFLEDLYATFYVSKMFSNQSTPVVNFTNVLQPAISPIFFCQKITKQNSKQIQIVSRDKLLKTLMYKKAACKLHVDVIVTCSQFHHFLTSSISTNILVPKNYKAKQQAHNYFSIHFRT